MLFRCLPMIRTSTHRFHFYDTRLRLKRPKKEESRIHGGSTHSCAWGSLRITGNTSRRLRLFAVTQIAASFVLLAGASMLLKTLLALQSAQTGMDTRRVLAMNVPGHLTR